MTMIDVDTSPLQAAREWRGIGLVAVAMNSGLPLAQAEALESGDPSAFGSVDEMIAAAVVYGASMGIGRDEAMALLDRTVAQDGVVARVPDPSPTRPNNAFSGAVQERSSRIALRDDVASTPAIDVPALPLVDPADTPHDHVPVDEPASPSKLDAELPAVPLGPSPEQAVAASGELHLDAAFGPDAPWERAGGTGELEAWVDDYDEVSDSPLLHRRSHDVGVLARVGTGAHAAIERIVGSDRADALADRTRELSVRMSELARRGRERLRRSEHATLFVAIGAGAILIAIVVALGGALGGDEPAGPGPADRTTATKAADAEKSAADTAAADKAEPAAPKAMLPPARLKVDVYNAGSQKGKAKTVAAKLDAAGYRIGDVTNAKTDYPGATIIHPADMAREARRLARQTGISTLQVAPGSTRTITVIVT